MLPLSLLRAAQDNQMLVELKSGETMNGTLVNCDGWMNMNLYDVTCTSKDGTKFWKMDECYIKGNNVKYLRVPDETMEQVKEEKKRDRVAKPTRGGRGAGASGRGDRGRGSSRGGGNGRGIPSDNGGRGRGLPAPSGTRGARGGPRGAGRGSGRGISRGRGNEAQS